MNYYEESHYRFRVGYMIASRLFGLQSFPVPADFGLLVTRQNVERHLNHQRRDLKKYLEAHHLSNPIPGRLNETSKAEAVK